MIPAVLLLLAQDSAAQVPSVEFNRDVRPILSDKCFTCHGPDPANRKTKLRFDIEKDAKIDLSRGRASIVPGDPEKSELYRRISSADASLRMPPAYAGHERLKDSEIEVIRQWITEGAKWQAHWSLVAPVRRPLPQVQNSAWPRNPIDLFILKRLEKEGLQPAAEATRSTLIRRVTLDLTGLPPTPADVKAFVNDASPNAYEKVVDRLLASPRYAERMAFRWMEAARYADTNGYQSDGPRDMWRWREWVIQAFDKNMPFDQFTVEQLAGDLLPNPTLDQRIATAFHRNHRTSAEGGIVPEEFRVEYVADRAETTSNVWLGLTVGCARCHDHKYDPIAQKDFYRLFAFFNSVPEKGNVYNFGNEDPVIKAPTPAQQQRLRELDQNVTRQEQQYARLGPRLKQAQSEWERNVLPSQTADWNVDAGLVLHAGLDDAAAQSVAGCDSSQPSCQLSTVDGPVGKAPRFDGKRFVETSGDRVNFNYQDPFTFAAWIHPESPKGAILSHSDDYLEGTGHGLYLMEGKLRLHVIFRWTDLGMRVETAKPLRLNSWQHVLVTYDGKRKASGVRMYIDGKQQEMKILFDELMWPISSKAPFRIGAGGGLRFQGSIDDVRVYNIALTPNQAAIVPLRKPLRELAAIPPAARSGAEADKLAHCFVEKFAPPEIRAARQELLKARAERASFLETIPTVMVMQDAPAPRETFVLKRGAYDNPGERVTPGVPAVLPPLPAGSAANRLALARWLVSSSNPLTARVAVNRYWQMYFGTGLVKTVDDFGSQGEWPIHPELLDWLALEFQGNGWNLKALQKTIVMSATYRQSSKASGDLLQKDPENRLLARGPRLRLGPDMIRDQALAVSGLLVNQVGGPSVKPYQPAGLWQELAGGKGYEVDKGEGLYRRSLYTYWKRTVAPPFMVNFDSPNRETCTVRETRTNTPLQALNLMNDVTFLEAARKLAERVLLEGGSRPDERITYAVQLVLAREPGPAERKVLQEALARFQARYAGDEKAAVDFVSQGDSPRNPGLQAKELAPYTALASVLLNLDETVTKE